MDTEAIAAVCVALGLTTTIVEISPIKINPWSCIWKMLKMLWKNFCRSLNADVLEKLAEIDAGQTETRQKLEDHIKWMTTGRPTKSGPLYSNSTTNS